MTIVVSCYEFVVENKLLWFLLVIWEIIKMVLRHTIVFWTEHKNVITENPQTFI